MHRVFPHGWCNVRRVVSSLVDSQDLGLEDYLLDGQSRPHGINLSPTIQVVWNQSTALPRGKVLLRRRTRIEKTQYPLGMQ